MYALPARLVSPRETTREAIARVHADALRGQSAPAVVAHEVFDARQPGDTVGDWRVRFTYADGTQRTR